MSRVERVVRVRELGPREPSNRLKLCRCGHPELIHNPHGCEGRYVGLFDGLSGDCSCQGFEYMPAPAAVAPPPPSSHGATVARPANAPAGAGATPAQGQPEADR